MYLNLNTLGITEREKLFYNKIGHVSFVNVLFYLKNKKKISFSITVSFLFYVPTGQIFIIN